MQQTLAPKPVVWVGSARRELKALPREVQRTMGIARVLPPPSRLLDRVAERLRQARRLHQQHGGSS